MTGKQLMFGPRSGPGPMLLGTSHDRPRFGPIEEDQVRVGQRQLSLGLWLATDSPEFSTLVGLIQTESWQQADLIRLQAQLAELLEAELEAEGLYLPFAAGYGQDSALFSLFDCLLDRDQPDCLLARVRLLQPLKQARWPESDYHNWSFNPIEAVQLVQAFDAVIEPYPQDQRQSYDYETLVRWRKSLAEEISFNTLDEAYLVVPASWPQPLWPLGQTLTEGAQKAILQTLVKASRGYATDLYRKLQLAA